MINTIFHFVNDPTFDYQTAVNNGDISEYTIVFNSADHSIYCKGAMFGRMSRADMAEALGNISDLIPVATDSTLGGIKIGYTNNADLNSRRYGVVLDDNNKAYVEVPWTDTITPEFDDTELRNIVATERGRIDNFISTLSATIDAKNRELYADSQWVLDVFGNVQDPGSVAAAYRTLIDNYLQEFDVWEYIDPEHPELGRKARIVELLNTEDGLTHRMGEAEDTIDKLTIQISTITHNIDGLSSDVERITTETIPGINLTIRDQKSTFELRFDRIEGRVSDTETDGLRMSEDIGDLKITATEISSRVTHTENDINGYYVATIKLAQQSVVEISTISTTIAALETIQNNQHFSINDFDTVPTDESLGTTVYKKGSQYFSLEKISGASANISELQQTATGLLSRVGAIDNVNSGYLVQWTSAIDQKANEINQRVGRVETTANNTNIALSDLKMGVYGTYTASLRQADNSAVNINTISTEIAAIETIADGQKFNGRQFNTLPDLNKIYKNDTQYFLFSKVDGVTDSIAELSTSLTDYESDTDGNLDKIVKMAAAVLNLKTSEDAQGYLTSMADLATVITSEGFNGYSGLASKVSLIDGAYVSQASLTTQLLALDVSGQIATATSGFATETFVRTTAASEADDAESAAKGYADDIVAGAKAEVIASIDDTVAGMTVLVTKDSNGVIDSGITLKADQVTIDANQTNFKNAVGTFVKTDVLEAGVADIKARLTVGGSDPAGAGTSGSITMKNASDGTIGIWDKDKLAVGTTSSPSSSNSAMLVNADGSGSLSKGNISWNTNGDVSVNGTGQFNGDVYANQFRAGGTSTFNITVESDAINFNYGSTRQAWFSTKKLEMNSSGEIVDTGNDAPQGFYLYMISPRTGNLVTIDFESGMFVEVTNGAVTVHTDSNTVKEITAGSYGTVGISNKTIYYTTDTSGSTPVNTYYWDSECTNQITGNLSDASHNYYLVVGDKYVVVNEDTGTGRSPYMLRRVTIYQPAKYDGNAHRIVSYGDRVYVIDKGTVSIPDKCFVVSLSSTAATLYNTSVYMENTTTTLDNMSSNMKLTSGSGSVQVYVATKSAGSSIPTLTNTLSIFTPGSGPNSPSMTKADYTVS